MDSDIGYDTTQQHPATWRRGAATLAAARATQHAAGACVAIQSLYRERGAYNTACDKANVRLDTSCDMARHGHDTASVRTTTRRCARYDTALCERPGGSARAACAQPGPWVCALYTRPSFESVHYFESLFESLFMNTVHEHCSRGFQK